MAEEETATTAQIDTDTHSDTSLFDEIDLREEPKLAIGLGIIGTYLLLAALSIFLVPTPRVTVADGPTPPSLAHPLGTTWLGESVLLQFVAATKWALLVAGLSALVTITIGANIGLLSGYMGGRVEESLMALTDMAMGLPVLPFGLVVGGVIGKSPAVITLAVGVVLWRTIARVVRSETKSIKQREFVLAAKARGASDTRIIYRHIFPNLLGLISVYLPLSAAWGLLTVSGIAFLGLVDPDMVTWGIMLQNVWSSGMMTSAPWWFAFPAFGIASLIVGLLLIARSLESLTNPRLQGDT